MARADDYAIDALLAPCIRYVESLRFARLVHKADEVHKRADHDLIACSSCLSPHSAPAVSDLKLQTTEHFTT